MNKLLCIISAAPFVGSQVVEHLEAAMVAAAFEMDVTVLFIDEGVANLQPGQNGAKYGLRAPGNMLAALSMYEIDKVFACADALARYAIDPQDAICPVQSLDHSSQSALISQQDVVLRGGK